MSTLLIQSAREIWHREEGLAAQWRLHEAGQEKPTTLCLERRWSSCDDHLDDLLLLLERAIAIEPTALCLGTRVPRLTSPHGEGNKTLNENKRPYFLSDYP